MKHTIVRILMAMGIGIVVFIAVMGGGFALTADWDLLYWHAGMEIERNEAFYLSQDIAGRCKWSVRHGEVDPQCEANDLMNLLDWEDHHILNLVLVQYLLDSGYTLDDLGMSEDDLDYLVRHARYASWSQDHRRGSAVWRWFLRRYGHLSEWLIEREARRQEG